jgi:hypothetical protein
MEAAAWIGLALLVLALGYVLDARAHGGARLRGDDGVGAFSDGGGMAAAGTSSTSSGRGSCWVVDVLSADGAGSGPGGEQGL